MTSQGLASSILRELLIAFEPVHRFHSAPGELGRLLAIMGWPPPSDFDPTPIIEQFDILADLEAAAEIADRIGDGELEFTPSDLEDLYDSLSTIINKIRHSSSGSPPDDLPPPYDTESFWQTFPDELLEYLLLIRMGQSIPTIAAALRLIGVITERRVPSSGVRNEHIRRCLKWENLGRFISEPSVLFNETYDWGTESFRHDELLASLDQFLGTIHRVRLSYPSTDVINAYYAQDNVVRGDLQEVSGPLLEGFNVDTNTEFSLGVFAFPIPADGDAGGQPIGLLVGTRAEGAVAGSVPVGPFVLSLQGGFESSMGPCVEFRPGSVTAGLEVSGANVNATAELALRLKQPALLFGAADSLRLQVSEIIASACIRGTPVDVESIFEIGLTDIELVIQFGDGDGFVGKIFGRTAQSVRSTVRIAWSSERGLYFTGGATLAVTIGLHQDIGAVHLEAITIQVTAASGDPVEIGVGVTGRVTLGPVNVSVEQIGACVVLEPRSGDQPAGNFGTLNLDAEFKAPTGAGVSIDASGIVGGGFLEFDHDNQRYAGVLGLNFGEIGLTAIGLITTKMPDGSDGFALLVNIGVIFDPPVQLAMGFTLSGVGGLIGVNRSLEVDVLRRGLRNRTLDSILFPDPSTVVANAAKIISDLRSVFPPAQDRYVVGPMVKIGWGSPNIITGDLGIFLEFPDPIRIVLMGQVEAALPEPDDALVVVHLDILGVVDFAKEELTFQAALYDSRIVSFDLFGDSAFLLGWGRDPRFALALGGFHPRFTPPPPALVFGDLKRLTLDISSGSKIQLVCSSYQALTPNSLQFGARADLHASSGGLSADGHLSFDALFYFSPFSFEVEISAGVHIKYEGVSLFGVDLTLLLSGPTPWHARGKARIKILFFSIKVGFSATWGEDKQATLPPIDPWDLVKEALEAPGNWNGVLPPRATMVESLRAMEDEEAVPVHPAGQFELRQNVAPLGVHLDKFGNAPLAGHDRFDVAVLTIDGQSLDLAVAEEFFARGQFQDLTADEQLSVPSFEKMQGGITASDARQLRVDGTVEEKSLEYESIRLKADGQSEAQETDGDINWLDWSQSRYLVQAEAARREVRRAGPMKRFAGLQPQPAVQQGDFTMRLHLRPRPKVEVSEQRFCIAHAADLSRVMLPAEVDADNHNLTRMVADRLLADQLEKHPGLVGQWLVISEYEVAA